MMQERALNHLKEEFFDELKVRQSVERGIEVQQRPRSFETISSELQLVRCVNYTVNDHSDVHFTVFNKELNRWPMRHFGNPDVRHSLTNKTRDTSLASSAFQSKHSCCSSSARKSSHVNIVKQNFTSGMIAPIWSLRSSLDSFLEWGINVLN